MGQYQFTPQAVSDLLEIWSFIAQDNPEAADRVEEAVFLSRQLSTRWSREERSDSVASSFLGCAPVFEVPDRLRS